MKMPKKIELANLPTRIDHLDRFSEELGVDIWIKRDDQTGSEISGNKVRKLEFAVKEAIDSGCDYLITCGGIQSNHARATAAVAARLGMGSRLVLRGTERQVAEGNLFLDKMLGATVRFITPEEYSSSRVEIMQEEADKLSVEGHKAYILPEGASNGIGSFGYINAFNEILEQEERMGIEFDAIVATVGSGGTFSGLLYGNEINGNRKDIIGFNIAGTAEGFREIVMGLLEEIGEMTGAGSKLEPGDIKIIDGYPGLGYALSRKEEIDFIRHFSMTEGIILDPVYTGKAMYGLYSEIKNGNLKNYKNILFIHTGGLFGWTEEARSLI
ncbi:D-cysteine desulfhydrase family protein [Gudongella oleilytica]|uniref:1-aminocyclopropane-1-carboxylate deaminase/D-cysteine desulfhydrase n=1 Tax=Gudongella oleilytica TaxID=1582259 RepID=UPI002A36089A|nr:D-cysteine desulfhydrase family protein [Gudongella oleilytica]MDY0256624.1 D-cysteine desulfhydrase family protein [Gudongella oleilytica]